MSNITIEVVITIILVGVAAYTLFNSFRKKSSGKCDCCSDGKSKRKFSR
ncbi:MULTISPECIES: FeoB-associated Cys-rich membrane protein [Clostridium]|nr:MULTISPECIES: FeoB-associated Cys-rich membrane protein [Clostridium]